MPTLYSAFGKIEAGMLGSHCLKLHNALKSSFEEILAQPTKPSMDDAYDMLLDKWPDKYLCGFEYINGVAKPLRSMRNSQGIHSTTDMESDEDGPEVVVPRKRPLQQSQSDCQDVPREKVPPGDTPNSSDSSLRKQNGQSLTSSQTASPDTDMEGEAEQDRQERQV